MDRFAHLKTDTKVSKARKASIPKKTQLDTNYCTRIWKEWRLHRNSTTTADTVPALSPDIDEATLQHWMGRFVLEIRKQDGNEYPANTLHHICCGIMRYLRQNGQPSLDFKDPAFDDFRCTLDSEMKRVQSAGIGTCHRQPEPLTAQEEEQLWKTGHLGDHSPQALVDTILFMCGVYFALRSGQEYRTLRFEPCQIQILQQPGRKACLRYTEDLSKSNPGGLKGETTSLRLDTP